MFMIDGQEWGNHPESGELFLHDLCLGNMQKASDTDINQTYM